MSTRGPSTVGGLILLATVAAAALLVADGPRQRRQAEEAHDFQRLVRGLGFGPALDLSDCAASFDPRLSPNCPRQDGPIPGGMYYCPQHACSIYSYPPLRPHRPENDVVLP
jgi:hypothetical protein